MTNYNKDNKGNWQFSFFQKKPDEIKEASIKVSMRPDNGFNPKYVHNYINPQPSKEELLIIKFKNNEKLSKTEQIILDNYLDKNKKAIETDKEDIIKYGLSAKPVTKEGRTRLLMETLKYQLKKGNNELVINIFLRLMEDTFTLTDEINEEYKNELNKMNIIVKTVDLIELQFTKFHSQMPPLNNKGFCKFDEWQISVINNIDKGISTVVNAPTSAGKSVLSGYITTKGKGLFVVPTDALAWQMSSYIGNITNTNIPILTETYQTNPNRDEMIHILNNSESIIGTPETILDYLPFLKNNFSWIVFDEIHMIGKIEGSGMEHILKILPNTPFLALSATIGNTDNIIDWIKSIVKRDISKIVCDKRFFNLNRYYYNKELIQLHPLALIEEDDIKSGNLVNKNLQPTPPNIYDLYCKLCEKFDMQDLNIHKYFDITKRIELNEANEFFDKLILFIIIKYQENRDIIMDIINNYKHTSLISNKINLTNLCFKLKQDNKNPVIIFHKNTLTTLRLARELAKDLEDLENKKYPKLFEERIKLEKKARRQDKHNEKEEKNNNDNDNFNIHKKETSKKDKKKLLGNIKLKKDGYGECSIKVDNMENKINVVSLQEPHIDFTLNNAILFNESVIEDWVQDLKKYFPNTGEYYHYIIKLLWRGVGIYAKGLPDPYLRLVQTLACNKQLAVVFSDISLVFGVSMPFRSVVIMNDNTLDGMLFLQMIGRAGRRGLDKEGNIIFAGFNWERIKELSLTKSPIINGKNNITFTFTHANEISKIYDTKQNWINICKNFLDGTTNEDAEEFIEGVVSNYKGGWNFGLLNNINHLHMNWRLRYNDGLIISYLIPYLRRAFESYDATIEKNQVEVANFLCRFICIKELSESENYLYQDPDILTTEPYSNMLIELEELDITFPKQIDNRLYLSIQDNLLFKNKTENEDDELRQRLIEFGNKTRFIQHYCYHEKYVGLCKLLGKLLTRIWWVYHNSSPIMVPLNKFDDEENIKNI